MADYVTTSNDGEFAFFSCNRGYNIKGSDILQCINGEWNMQPPTCQEIPRSCRSECNFYVATDVTLYTCS